ncbi:hypothetical protein LguiA_023359 [Lonicera macranthoides]
MASSDDECEPVPQAISNYHFVDDADEPISFSKLPVQWNEVEHLDGGKRQIFLHGTADGGLQKVYKQVTAWKFDLSGVKPEISVLSKDMNWINLQKPRKSFIDIIRSSLITVHCLHILRKKPETSGRTLWDHLSKDFSLYEIKPSEDDLLHHKNLINEAVKRDKVLAKSKFLVTFVMEQPRKRKALDEDIGTMTKSGFLDDSEIVDEAEEDGSDEEGELFDSVCAICDNGGELLCCEGRCLRSFHATADAGSDSMCESLGLSDEQVEAIQNFFCKNCESKQHQCFSCGELGSSDKSSGAEVFACVSATCGLFYHPRCVAKVVHRKSDAEAEDFQRRIAAGEPFTCPVHKCYVCKQAENKTEPELQFALCRRCPKSYHRKCLPRRIAFEDMEDEGIIQRAWEDLLPNRILIYCLDHEIDDEIATPSRNHIKFPNIGQKKKMKASDQQHQLSRRDKVAKKERNTVSEDAASKRTVVKPQKCFEKLSSAIKKGDSSKRREQISSGPECSTKKKEKKTSLKPLNKVSSTKVNKSTAYDSENSLGERISALMRDAESSIKLEDIIKKHKIPSRHTHSSRNMADKAITLGKVERSIEAVRAALKKLEEGRCGREDAIAVCEPELVDQIFKWQSKFKCYLAPFLPGMCYSSFGRHFTQVGKLKEIVDMVHWYVQDGDMVVDFCCGANDFSCLMKKRLDEMGKKCSYKNFDILQAKNDFEERDRLYVRPKELPTGSKLVMGLNPLFGNATLANKFIDIVLAFKPKLLILIVPQETERLDKKEKEPRYDLIWEDDELLSSKSFCIPGSVDVNDKQIDQWKLNPPPLYLWSRADWTAKHKAIAQQQGHLSRLQPEPQMEHIPDIPMEDHEFNIENSTMIDDRAQNEEPEELPERAPRVIETGEEGVARNNCKTKVHNSNINNQSYKRKHCEAKIRRGSGATLGSDGRGYKSYLNDMDKKYGNDGEVPSLVQHYGQEEPDSVSQRSSYLVGHDPEFSSPNNRMSALATQRYGPQLDESNHVRMGSSLGSEVPYESGSGFYEPLALRPGFQADPLAFAPGPYHPLAQENSVGWLDE